jgi:uncharacterized protein YecT (DUF1311 family)
MVMLAGWGTAARAQHMNLPTSPCVGIVGTSDATQCLWRASRAADRALDRTYGEINQVLAPAERQQLRNVEQLWLRYRVAACVAERDLYGQGTGSGPAYLACIEAETRQCIGDLRATYWWRVEKFSK